MVPISWDIDVLDDDERLAKAMKGGLRERHLDPMLQRLAAHAARVSGFPIALVSLVQKDIQFFRAHVGLPDDLQNSRETERRVSFCQFVVSSGEPVIIRDAAKHPALPQELVGSHAIRAYAGFPVRLGSHVVGTLCLLDTRPRELSEPQHQQLKALADAVEYRLGELALEAGQRGDAQQVALQPAFGEINNLLMSLTGMAHVALESTRELKSAIEPLEAGQTRKLTQEDAPRSQPAAAQTALSGNDLRATLEEINETARSLTESIAAVRTMLMQERGPQESLAAVINTASIVAHHATKVVGGITWEEALPSVHISGGQCRASLVLSTALTLMSGAMFATGGGIRGAVSAETDSVTVSLVAPGIGEDALDSVAFSLATMVGSCVELQVSNGHLNIEFLRV